MTSYYGGKQRLGKKISDVLRTFEKPTYCEPFCGMCGVLKHVVEWYRYVNILAGDINESVIKMWQDALEAKIPYYRELNKETYNELMKGPSSAEKGFFSTAYGYRGLPHHFYPYGRSKIEHSIERITQMAIEFATHDVRFTHGPYTQFSGLENALIYCDPPYRRCQHKYVEDDGKAVVFDYDKFYDWCREMSKRNTVIISEYWMPDDFVCIWSNDRPRVHTRGVEKLFLHKSTEHAPTPI